MVRAYMILALAFGLATATGANPAWAQPAQAEPPDPFTDGANTGPTNGSAAGSAVEPAAGSAAGPAAGSAVPDTGAAMPAEGTSVPATNEPPVPAGCENVATDERCGEQTSSLLMKSGGYVIIAVLLFSLLRVWWDKRGTSSAGLRFVSTMLPAASLAGVLAYLDPMRSQALACCIHNGSYASNILLQDSDLGRAALLGFVPAAALFVVVAIIVKAVRS